MSGDEVSQVSARQRTAAVVSLISGAVLLVVLLVFLIRNGGHIIVALVGFALVVAAAWLHFTRKGVQRAAALLVAPLGVIIVVWAGVKADAAADRPLLRAVVTVVLAVVSVWAARLALIPPTSDEQSRSHAGTVPKHPVLICNPWSGGGKVEKFGLAELAQSLGVETIMLDHGLDLEQLARDAVARGADCLGMAGGDGSQALVASIAVEHGLPFVCVSAGTRNHFALDLGINRDDPRDSVYGFRDAIERRIDYATVNGRFFVNNVSLGIYATIVQQDDYRENKAQTTRELLPEMLGNTEHSFDLQFTEPDGTEVDGAWLIQVSNNPYVIGPSLDLSQRRRIDTGRLGVYAVTGATAAEAASVVTLTVVGQRNLSRNWHEFASAEFEVRSRSGKAFAGVDGEALEMDTPMRFRIYPLGLRLFVPKASIVVAKRRRARDVTITDVLKVAKGINPDL